MLVFFSASTMANVTIFPIGKSLQSLKPRICDGTINLHILAVVSKSSQVRILGMFILFLEILSLLSINDCPQFTKDVCFSNS